MPDPVIELALFRARPEVTGDALLAAAETATEYLKACRGFSRRRLVQGADGQWLDHVEWRSTADALDAAARFGESPLTAPFRDAIEPSSVQLRHFTIRAAVD